MENQYRKVNGYRELTETEISLMNLIKKKGEELLVLQKELVAKLALDAEIKCSRASSPSEVPPRGELEPECVEWVRFQTAEPLRWAAIGKTDIQTGIMALMRAVAQPAI